MRNIKSILRYFRGGNSGIMTVRPTTLNLEAVKRAPELTYGDPDWAADAERFSVSGTALWVQGKLGWYQITASSKKQSTVKLSWSLHCMELVKGRDNATDPVLRFFCGAGNDQAQGLDS